MKLYFVKNGLYGSENQNVKEKAFTKLESLRRKVPQINYDEELEQYREEKPDYIVTRNCDDFKGSQIPCIEPDDFCEIM